MSDEFPKRYRDFMREYRPVWEAYNRLGAAVHQQGPLDEKTRTLVKLGIAVGARLEGAVHSQTRKALDAGASPDEIRHAVLLAIPTVGFPGTMAAMSWVEDQLE
jgi:alkylhydroperoxidase/carboxymuconolactone decarboxylase family protein YurZ